MKWQMFLNQLSAEYKDVESLDPSVEVYDARTGRQYNIVSIYNEDDIICIDVEPKD